MELLKTRSARIKKSVYRGEIQRVIFNSVLLDSCSSSLLPHDLSIFHKKSESKLQKYPRKRIVLKIQMGILNFLKFTLLCIDFLAWPVLALGYPLCASIRAIETGSKYHMRKLVIYWTLFSLISLFERAFIKLIEWIPLWSFIKFIAICWLVMPRFDGACFVYQRLMNPCSCVNLRALVGRLCRPNKEQSLSAETLVAVTQRYIKENGSEAFENLMKRKLKCIEPESVQKDIEQLESRDKIDADTQEQVRLNTPPPPVQKDIEQLESRDKIDADTQEQPNCEEPEVAQKEINALEPTEKIASTTEEQHSAAKISEEAHGRLREVPVKKVQQEWACALCQVTTTSEKTLRSHLEGSKHKSKWEALTRSKQDTKSRSSSPSTTHKSKRGTLEPEMGNIGEGSKQNLNRKTEEIVQPPAESVRQTQKQANLNGAGSNQTTEVWCHICKVKLLSEIDLASHLRGRKHSTNIQNIFDSYVVKGVISEETKNQLKW